MNEEPTTSAIATAVEVTPVPSIKAPATWAKLKSTPAWVLGGAYHAKRWEKDSAGNDLSLISETDFDAACAAVASISIDSAPHPRARQG